jgi:hypothetical protein
VGDRAMLPFNFQSFFVSEFVLSFDCNEMKQVAHEATSFSNSKIFGTRTMP